MSQPGIMRTSIQLFRDALRLANHIAGKSSPKGRQLVSIIRAEFKKNKDENDVAKIEAHKGAAIRGLATYLMMESSSRDERFTKNSANFTKKTAESLKNTDCEKTS